VYAVAAATGRVQSRLRGFRVLDVADFDRDGLADLFGTVEGGTKVRVFRGTPPELWGVLGNGWQPGPDLDNDGIADVIDTNDPEHTTALSGADGHRLWSAAVGGLVKGVTPPPDGDLDGDGVPDVLVVQEQLASGLDAGAASVRALSGRTGKQLWSVRINTPLGETVTFVNGRTLYLRCHRFSPGGPPDVLFGYMRVRRAGFSWPGLRMARISGGSGRVVWDEALDEPRGPETGLSSWELQPALADLDGDGVLDLVLWVPITTAGADADRFNRGCQVRAFSGKDGKLLWKGPSFAGTHQAPNARFGLPVPAVWRGAGGPEVAVTTYDKGENAPAGRRPSCEVVVLNGKDGEVEWRWRGDDGFSSLGWRDATPKLVRQATGTALCVSVQDSTQVKVDPKTGRSTGACQLVLLDPVRHQVFQRRDFEPSARLRVPFWVHDLDGAGNDEVLFIENGTMYALRGGLKDWWNWKLPAQDGSLVRIDPGRHGQPATVVVASGGSLYGLDGSTGHPRWRCDGAHTSDALLTMSTSEQPPRVLSVGLRGGPVEAGICRQALAVGPDGKYLPPEPAKQPDGHPPPADPRLARPLPWRSLATVPDNDVIKKGVFGLALLLGALVLPVWLFRLAYRRQSGRLTLLPVLWLGGLYLWAFLGYGTRGLEAGALYLAAAVVLAGPLLLFVVLVARSTFRRRWRVVVLLLAFGVLATLITAGVWLAADARHMDPAEHYSWRGWYAVSLAGVYCWGALLAAGLCGWGLFRVGRRLGSRLLRRPRPA
jgi:outer membrane protein assembly factor BamB